MRLQSLRDLKDELKEGPALPRDLARALGLEAAARAYRVFAERVDGVHTRAVRATGLAIGVARGRRRGDYRLGVRVQARGREAAALAEGVRARAKGEAEVRIVPRVRVRRYPEPRWFRGLRRPLECGLSIGQAAGMAGTLGAIVRDRDGLYALSNNHVLAAVNTAEPGDPVAQPGDLDRRMKAATIVGVLDRFVPISFSRSNVVDCAVAQLFPQVEAWPGRNRAARGLLRPPRAVTLDDLGLAVLKVGRTSGVTRGRITQVEVDRLRVEMGDGRSRVALFSDQIEIEGEDGRPFSADGDSGSLVIDPLGRPRALLFCGGEDADGRDLTYANRIETVLAKLGVRMAR